MTRRITVLQMNDSHGYLGTHLEAFHDGGRTAYRRAGGYARVASVLDRARAELPGAVLAFDNGDTFHGTRPAVETRGGALLPVLSALRFDAMTAHWDFAYGPARLHELASALPYPVLACNVYRRDDGALAFPAWAPVEAAGLEIGVIGVASNIVDKTMPPHFSEGLRFTSGREEVPDLVRRLRAEDRIDLILVLSHLGLPQDLALAAGAPGIDVLLSGHTHNRLFRPLRAGGAVVIQSGKHGSFVGRLDLEVDDGRITRVRHELIVLDETIPVDPALDEIAAGAAAPWSEAGREVVGATRTPLDRETILESTMDDVLLQALSAASGAELAFSNGWRYGAPVDAGPVALEDLWNILPGDPPVSVIDLTGAEVRRMLEDNLEKTFSPDPFGQMGGYVKRCRGLNAFVKIENPAGTRVQELFLGGRPAEDDRVYRAAFVTMQAVPPGLGTNRRDLDVRGVQAMRDLLSRGPVDAGTRGTIVAV